MNTNADLYFKDTFFSAGESAILDEAGESVGMMDLHGLARAKIDIYGPEGELRYLAKLMPFLLWWKVMNPAKEELGMLTLQAALLKRKFKYDAGERGMYTIEAPAFTKEFVVTYEGAEVASLIKTNNFWSYSDAYWLHNESKLDAYEWVAVAMGVNTLLRD